MKTVTYVENFVIDLSSDDALKCDGVNVDNNVLRGFNGYRSIDARTDYMGFVGANSKYLFPHTDRLFRRYDGEAFKNLQVKNPNNDPTAKDARYDIYRDVAYLAFDNDGVLRYDEQAASNASRWAWRDSAADIAVVNERLVMLTEDGMHLRFAECGDRLYSDEEKDGYAVPDISLPSQVQAITRFDVNTLYALGNTCYKVRFYADERDISLTTVADGLGKVSPRSVVQIGDKIVFAAADGICVLRNGTVTPIFGRLNNVVSDFSVCRAKPWRGKYVLFVPQSGGYCGYVLDVNKNICSAMLCRDVRDICVYRDTDVMITVGGELVRSSAELFRSVRFARSRIDFGNLKRKHLRRLNIVTKHNVDIFITDESGARRVYRVNGSKKLQSLRIRGSGRAFDMEILSSGQTEVTALSLVAEISEEDRYGS